MLRRIETKENIPDFIEGVKDGDERLMGFGHRVYKNYDPRATIIKKAADDVFEVTGKNPLLDIAHRAREDRARGRLLHLAQALPERRLLLGPDLRGAGAAGRDVPGDVRDRAHQRLDRPVAGDGRGQGAEDRPPAPDLHRRARRATTCRSSSAGRRERVPHACGPHSVTSSHRRRTRRASMRTRLTDRRPASSSAHDPARRQGARCRGLSAGCRTSRLREALPRAQAALHAAASCGT